MSLADRRSYSSAGVIVGVCPEEEEGTSLLKLPVNVMVKPPDVGPIVLSEPVIC